MLHLHSTKKNGEEWSTIFKELFQLASCSYLHILNVMALWNGPEVSHCSLRTEGHRVFFYYGIYTFFQTSLIYQHIWVILYTILLGTDSIGNWKSHITLKDVFWHIIAFWSYDVRQSDRQSPFHTPSQHGAILAFNWSQVSRDQMNESVIFPLLQTDSEQ